MTTHYEVLGVTPKAQPEEVRTAYRQLAKSFHPDLNPDPRAHERMALINVAFEVLSDPVRRMEYDAAIGHSPLSEPGADRREANQPDSVQATVLHRHRHHRTPVYSIAFLANGQMASSSFDNEVLFWKDMSEPERRVKLEGGVVSSVEATKDGKLIAAGSTEQSLACWTLHDGVHDVWRQTPKDWICCLKPSPDGQSLAMGQMDATIRVASVQTGATRWQTKAHEDSVTSVAWSEDGSYLATGSADATVKIWCGATGRLLKTITRVRATVTSMAFSPNGRWLAVAGVDLSIRVFHLEDCLLRHTFFGHKKPIEGLAFHPRSWLLGSCSRDGCLGLWNIKFGIGHGLLEASHQPLACLAFHPDGQRLATGGLDKALRVWRLSSPKI